MPAFCRSLAVLLAATNALAQNAFEAISVHPSGPQSSSLSGGPGTTDPTRIQYGRVTLVRLLSIAYGVQWDQISGPDWLWTDEFDISAKIEAGATKSQVAETWKAFLAERFNLSLHHATKSFVAYDLSVAKSGPKLKPTTAPADVLQQPLMKRRTLAPGQAVQRLTCTAYTIEELIQNIYWPLGTSDKGYMVMGRIEDHTGLTGRYDFTLEFRGMWGPGGAFPSALPVGEPEPAPELAQALEQQLGLRLTMKKIPLDVLVVDRGSRIPAKN